MGGHAAAEAVPADQTAAPVAAPDALADLAPEADHVVCLAKPVPFVAVGQHYTDFGQTPDAAVIAALAQSPSPHSGPEPAGPEGRSD